MIKEPTDDERWRSTAPELLVFVGSCRRTPDDRLLHYCAIRYYRCPPGADHPLAYLFFHAENFVLGVEDRWSAVEAMEAAAKAHKLLTTNELKSVRGHYIKRPEELAALEASEFAA